jgi:hypothetical protein
MILSAGICMDIARVFKPRNILIVCALVVGNTQASTVFTGSVSGYFDNPDAGRRDYTNIKNNDQGKRTSASSTFSWGLTRPRHRHHHYCGHRRGRMSSSSSFAFDGIGSDRGEAGFTASLDQAFSLGDFDYTNKATYFSRHVEGVDFSLAFELDGYGTTEFTYMLNILNTPNNSSNPADFVSLVNEISSQPIWLDNVLYELEILGFSRDGGNSFENSTWADEGSSTSAEIYARFNTVSAVPIPAAAWLFGSGLLGLVAFARKHS